MAGYFGSVKGDAVPTAPINAGFYCTLDMRIWYLVDSAMDRAAAIEKGRSSLAISRHCREGVEHNRRPSQLCRLGRVADGDIIAPRRSSSAHLRRSWRATVDEDGHYSFAVPL